MTSRMKKTALVAAVVAAQGLVSLGTAQGASAAALPSCPGGESPCVYLAGGTYSVGNPINLSPTSVGGFSDVVLTHCDSTGAKCYDTVVNIPGLTISSTSTTVISLNVPGEGVGLNGIRPTLYTGLPTATPGGRSAGLTLTVTGTAFVVYDTSGAFTCSAPVPVSTGPVSGYAGCSYSVTLTV